MRQLNLILLITFFFFSFTLKTFSQKRAELAKRPPMGWNSWNWYGKQDINEKKVREVIDAIAKNGLKDAGYNYIIVDGGWRDKKLSIDGQLLSDPVKFPGGMKALADYAHSKGLKFGVHTVPGTHDCGGDPVGGFNREEIHVKQFVDWGLDFVKVDLCRQKEDTCKTCEKTKSGWSEGLLNDTYYKWSKLLHNCGRDIVFNISAYKFREWNPEVCNMSRTTFDIQSKRQKEGAIFNSEKRENRPFMSVMAIAELNNKYASYVGKGYWNDPDMLVTGEQGLTFKEQQSHFCLWSIMTAPLFLGNDPLSMSKEEKQLVLNNEIILIDQDTTEQGTLVKQNADYQIWKKKLANNQVALLVLNLNASENKSISVDFKELGLHSKLFLNDVLNQKKLGKFENNFTVKLTPHECSFLKIKEIN